MRVVVLCLLLGVAFCAPSADEITSLPGWTGPLPSKMYSGYLAVKGGKYDTCYYHYWLETAQGSEGGQLPVVHWQQGGPGSNSIEIGLFTEMGSLHIDARSLLNHSTIPKVLPNPYSWNKLANMLYLESPPGVGYSYCTDSAGRSVSRCEWDDITQAEEMYQAYLEFFKQFPEYASNDFYVTGESYGGNYVPNIANVISQHPEFPVKFKGFAVGNGVTGNQEPRGREQIHVDLLYAKAFFSKRLRDHIYKVCHFPDTSGNECRSALDEMSAEAGRYNIYFVYDSCYKVDYPFTKTFREHMQTDYWASDQTMGGFPYPCGTYPSTIQENFMKNPKVQAAMHVSRSKGECEFGYNANSNPSIKLYPDLVKKYRILIYNGDADACVPYDGDEDWTFGLGLQVLSEWKPWTSEGAVAGSVTKFAVPGAPHNFTFATVRASGHMVPTYRPAAAFDLFTHFIKNEL